jgi:hypothetical protein
MVLKITIANIETTILHTPIISTRINFTLGATERTDQLHALKADTTGFIVVQSSRFGDVAGGGSDIKMAFGLEVVASFDNDGEGRVP